MDASTDIEPTIWREILRVMDLVEPISTHHVGAWLRTEYDTAIIRAHQAADWVSFERNKDVLPNLQWMPTTSPSPEAGHRLFWQKPLILPVDDPFWSEHRPGDRWNCKCSLDSTDAPVNALDPEELSEARLPKHAAQAGLEGNPARKGLITDQHPYYPKNCASCPHYKAVSLKAWLKKKVVGRVKDCHSCEYVDKALLIAKRRSEFEELKRDSQYHPESIKFDEKTGGIRATHKGHKNADVHKEIYFENMTSGKLEEACCEQLFRMGNKVILLDEKSRGEDGNTLSSLDMSLNGQVMDIRSITTHSSSYVNALTDKNKQLKKYNQRADISSRSDSLCLYFHDPSMYSEERMRKSLNSYQHILSSRNTEIQIREIYIVIRGKDEIIRFSIM